MTKWALVTADETVPLGCCHGCGAHCDVLNKVTFTKAGTIVYLCFACIDRVYHEALHGPEVC